MRNYLPSFCLLIFNKGTCYIAKTSLIDSNILKAAQCVYWIITENRLLGIRWYIPCHGDVIDSGARKTSESILKYDCKVWMTYRARVWLINMKGYQSSYMRKLMGKETPYKLIWDKKNWEPGKVIVIRQSWHSVSPKSLQLNYPGSWSSWGLTTRSEVRATVWSLQEMS